jgi:hypothetical protein
MANTHWRTFYDTEFLAAYDLDNGNGGHTDITAKIEYAKRERIVGSDGKKEECLVLHLVGRKPMICNITNAKTLEKLFHTPYVEQWSGRSITIGTERVSAFGDVVDALRIRKTIPREQGKLTCHDCSAEIVATEKMSAAQIVAVTQKRYGRMLCATCWVGLAEADKLTEQDKADVAGMAKQHFSAVADEAVRLAGELEKRNQPVPNEPDADEQSESEFEKAMREGGDNG